MESTTLKSFFSSPLKYTSRPAAQRISDCGTISLARQRTFMQYSVVRPEISFTSYALTHFFALAHTDDSATADFKSNLLQHMNIFNTLVKGVGGADMAVIGAAAV